VSYNTYNNVASHAGIELALIPGCSIGPSIENVSVKSVAKHHVEEVIQTSPDGR
jgi:hypothetical protein